MSWLMIRWSMLDMDEEQTLRGWKDEVLHWLWVSIDVLTRGDSSTTHAVKALGWAVVVPPVPPEGRVCYQWCSWTSAFSSAVHTLNGFSKFPPAHTLSPSPSSTRGPLLQPGGAIDGCFGAG